MDRVSINQYAFFNCSSITSIVIGESVNAISYNAFEGCDSLVSLTFNDTTTWYSTENYNDWQNMTGGTETSVTNPSTNASDFKTAETVGEEKQENILKFVLLVFLERRKNVN